MARESRAEIEVRESITKYLAPDETLREFTRSKLESTSSIRFLFGAIGEAFANMNQSGFMIGLTEKRLILAEVKGKAPTGNVHSIPLSDIKGLTYNKGAFSGTVNLQLSADTMRMNFDSRPWYPRAQNMANLFTSLPGGTETFLDSQSQALSYLEKAEIYNKLGLNAQVEYELEQIKRLDPYMVQETRYKTLLEDRASKVQDAQALKIPLRIGAGMLVVNAVLNVIFLIIVIASGAGTNFEAGDIVAPIVDIIIAVNLWRLKEQWKRGTVWWAAIGLVLFGVSSLASGDYFSLIIQVGFSGSLILLLAGTPSKARTIAAVAVFLVVYLGLICLILGLSFLGALAGTG